MRTSRFGPRQSSSDVPAIPRARPTNQPPPKGLGSESRITITVNVSNPEGRLAVSCECSRPTESCPEVHPIPTIRGTAINGNRRRPPRLKPKPMAAAAAENRKPAPRTDPTPAATRHSAPRAGHATGGGRCHLTAPPDRADLPAWLRRFRVRRASPRPRGKALARFDERRSVRRLPDRSRADRRVRKPSPD